MPKYLLKASYNAEGVRGVMKEGGSKREAAARALVKSLGGKVESFYFCHGDADAIVICDFPDIASALAGVMAVNASGVVVASTTPLMLVLPQACRVCGAFLFRCPCAAGLIASANSTALSLRAPRHVECRALR